MRKKKHTQLTRMILVGAFSMARWMTWLLSYTHKNPGKYKPAEKAAAYKFQTGSKHVLLQ